MGIQHYKPKLLIHLWEKGRRKSTVDTCSNAGQALLAPLPPFLPHAWPEVTSKVNCPIMAVVVEQRILPQIFSPLLWKSKKNVFGLANLGRRTVRIETHFFQMSHEHTRTHTPTHTHTHQHTSTHTHTHTGHIYLERMNCNAEQNDI